MALLWHHNFCEVAIFSQALRIRIANPHQTIRLLACRALETNIYLLRY